MIQNEEPYKMRGRRVPAMDQQEIALFAKSFLRLIGINVSNRHELLDKIENLYGLDQFPLVVDLVDDEEWKRCYYGIAEGLFEPAHLQISLPNSTYEDAHRWELSAVRTFLHEVV